MHEQQSLFGFLSVAFLAGTLARVSPEKLRPMPHGLSGFVNYDDALAYDEIKTTVGDKNMDLKITRFNDNAQPYYAVVDAKGKTIVNPIGYSTVEDFVRFLGIGKKK